MIRRLPYANHSADAIDGWGAVRNVQQMDAAVGFVSQPAHAQLAGRLAGQLHPEVFGELPAEIIDAIANHDSGWAAADLAGLDGQISNEPESFVTCDPRVAIGAWTRSIRQAEAISSLGGSITSRHFCLLAPKDGDKSHVDFVEAETPRRLQREAALKLSAETLDRYTAVIGFCDLLSLCLCSGLEGTYRLPFGHPADPHSGESRQLTLSVSGQAVSFGRHIFRQHFSVRVTAWLKNSTELLSNHELQWAVR